MNSMQARSIDELLEEVAVWSFRNSSGLSESAQQAFGGVPFRLQETHDGKDYKTLMDTAIENYRLFVSYLIQLNHNNFSSVQLPNRIGEKRKAIITQQFKLVFSVISTSLYQLFVKAAQEFIETKLDDNITGISAYEEIRDNGVYLVIEPEIRGFKIVEETYKERGTWCVRDDIGKVVITRKERHVYEATVEEGRIIKQRRLNPSIISTESVAKGLIYVVNPSPTNIVTGFTSSPS